MKKEEDPFWEPPEDILIGTANVFLQSLSYALDFDDKLAVTDYKVCISVSFEKTKSIISDCIVG